MRRFWTDHVQEGELVQCAICPGQLKFIAGKPAWVHLLRVHRADLNDNIIAKLNEKHGLPVVAPRKKKAEPVVHKQVDRGNGFGED